MCTRSGSALLLALFFWLLPSAALDSQSIGISLETYNKLETIYQQLSVNNERLKKSARELGERLERAEAALQRSEGQADSLAERLADSEARIDSLDGHLGEAQEAALENGELIGEFGRILEEIALADMD